MNRISEFLVGLLFGLGLMLSGMTDPGKVLGFLDLAGAWDPSLALVMGGALYWPDSSAVDKRLVLGSLVFGMGWGLAGFCPGPAVVSLAAGQPKAAVFVVAMLAGMAMFALAERWLRAPRD